MSLSLQAIPNVTVIGRSFRIRVGCVAIAVAILAACTQTAGNGGSSKVLTAELNAALDAHLVECTEIHGLNPLELSGIGENELAAGEKEWLECAYRGVEAIMVPATEIPDMYRQLIADSRSMTDLVGEGEMTRTQRRTVMQAAIAEIEKAEIGSLRGSAAANEADRARTAGMRSAFVGTF